MNKRKIFILLGPPGSGKGTLALKCVQEFGWLQLSTGNLCRDHIHRQTELGKKIQDIIAQGLLVPDDIIADLVIDWLHSFAKLPEGILFDGYPRTQNQVIVLYDLLQKKLQEFDIVLVKVNIDISLLEQRVVNRVVCSNKDCGQVYSLLTLDQEYKTTMTCKKCGHALTHRLDDSAESLKQRLVVYFQHEQEILDFCLDKGLSLITLNGAAPKQDIFEKFKTLALQNHGH